MKVLKTLLTLLTALAVACTALLLFEEDKKTQNYIQIYGDED